MINNLISFAFVLISIYFSATLTNRINKAAGEYPSDGYYKKDKVTWKIYVKERDFLYALVFSILFTVTSMMFFIYTVGMKG